MRELVYGRLLRAAADRYGDRVAWQEDEHAATFEEHLDRVARLSAALAGLGVRPADHFCVLANNSHRYLELWHAALAGAGVIVPLNYRLAPPELARVLEELGPVPIFVDGRFVPLLRASLGTRERVSGCPIILMSDIAEDDLGFSAVLPYEELLSSEKARLPVHPEEEHPAVLMYTGGTTGRPKGVVLSHRAEMLNLYHECQVLAPRREDVFLHLTPMFHAGSMYGILAPTIAGGKCVFLERFDPPSAIRAVELHGVTDTHMVPTMIAMLLDTLGDRTARLATLRRIVYGGSVLQEGLARRLRDILPQVQLFNGYGMTEATSTLTYLTGEDHGAGRSGSGCAGRPLMGVVLTIEGPNGDQLPRGVVGEICASGGNIMSGYWQAEGETHRALRGGHYHTGDIGYFDADGYLFVRGRMDDMIVSGGENVYPTEVEDVLSTYPAVVECAVVGLPDDLWGERVHAIVVTRERENWSEADLSRYLRRSLAGYKVPKSFEFLSAPLPVSPVGKVRRSELREARIRSSLLEPQGQEVGDIMAEGAG